MKNKVLILLTIVALSQNSELLSSSKQDRKQLIIDKFGSINRFHTDAENYYSSSEDEICNANFDQDEENNYPKTKVLKKSLAHITAELQHIRELFSKPMSPASELHFKAWINQSFNNDAIGAASVVKQDETDTAMQRKSKH